jgi:hypothetical protein
MSEYSSNLHSSGSSSASWHSLYQAALFETDRELIPARIAKAEKAILDRVKELFGVDSDTLRKTRFWMTHCTLYGGCGTAWYRKQTPHRRCLLVPIPGPPVLADNS